VVAVGQGRARQHDSSGSSGDEQGSTTVAVDEGSTTVVAVTGQGMAWHHSTTVFVAVGMSRAARQ
jgi:hypothetical protein